MSVSVQIITVKNKNKIFHTSILKKKVISDFLFPSSQLGDWQPWLWAEIAFSILTL